MDIALKEGIEYLGLRVTADERIVNDAPLLFETKYNVKDIGGLWELTATRYFALLGWTRVGRAHIRPHAGRVWLSAH